MQGFTRSQITLSNGVEFKIVHNIPKSNSISLRDFMDQWIQIAKKHTDKSFANYIKSHTTFQAYTEEEFKKVFTYEIKVD